MRWRNRSVLDWALVMLASVTVNSPATAQTISTQASSVGLEEIVVTATRREERLQDVPVSVTAFTQERLDVQGLRSIDDLTRFAPGVAFSRNGTGSSANYNDENSDINIRGIDSTAGTSTTGIYINDTPIQGRHLAFGTLNPYPALFDLARVEVLRGPQGTLFGAGSEGGTIRFITPEPDLRAYTGYVRSELGWVQNGDPLYELGAAAGGPLIDDQLGFRASASYRRDGGWVDRGDYRTLSPIDKNANWHGTVTFRAELKWALTEKISVKPSFYYQELKINDTAAYWPMLSNPADNRFLNGNAQPDKATDPFYLAGIKLNWNLGFAQLTANASYYSRNQHATTDFTQFDRIVYGLPEPYAPLAPPGDFGTDWNADEQRNSIAEVRMESLDAALPFSWSAGVFYAHLKEDNPETIVDPTLNAELGGGYCSARAPCPNGLIYSQPVFQVIDKQIAGFGELSAKLPGGLKVTAALRVSHVQYDGESSFYGPFASASAGPTTPIASSGSGSETPITPKAVISYESTPDHLFYISAAKGYRVGGINADVGSICQGDLATIGLAQVPTQYSADSLWSYEIGAKNALFEKRVQLNVSLFTINWSNIQQNVYLPSCGQQFVANLGQVRSHGGEVEMQARPLDALQFGLSVAYVDAKYTKAVCAGPSPCTGASAVISPVVSEGNRLPGAPWTVLAWTEYRFPDIGVRAPYARVDYQVTTAQTAKLPIQDPNNGVSDPTIPGLPQTRSLALRIGARWSGLDLSVFAQNLTNTHAVLFSSRDTTSSTLYYDRSVRPRTVGVTAIYRY